MVVTQEIGHKHLNFTFFTGPGVQLLSDAVEHCNGSFEESPVKSHLHNTIHYLFSLSIFSKTCVWHMFLIVEYDLCLFTLLKTLDYCQTLLKINISNCFHVLSSPPLSTQVWQDETLFLLGIWLLLLPEESGLEGGCIHIIRIVSYSTVWKQSKLQSPSPLYYRSPHSQDLSLADGAEMSTELLSCL